VDREAKTTVEHVDLKDLLGDDAYGQYKAGAYRTPKPAPVSDPAPDSSDGISFDDSFRVDLETTPTTTYEEADKTPGPAPLPKSKPRPPLYTPATCTPSDVRAVRTSKSVVVPSPMYTTPADPNQDQNRIKTIPPPTVAKDAVALPAGMPNPYHQPIWMQYTKQRGWVDWIPFIVVGLIVGGAAFSIWRVANQNQDRRRNAPQQEQVEQKSYCPDCPVKNGYYGF
jgi:hypothetical protein